MFEQDCNTTMSSEHQSQASPMTPGDSDRIRNNLMYKLGLETEKPRIVLPARAQERALEKFRVVTEPLKDPEEKESDDKTTSALWGFASLFGAKKDQPERNEESSLGDSPSLSSSFSSSIIGDNADSILSVGSISSTLRKLKFNEQVEVCLIPKKEEYSKRIRGHLWNSPEEMALNAHRNTVEFAAEGWDWRNVMEDENMYRCLSTNELIHPVHIEHPSP